MFKKISLVTLLTLGTLSASDSVKPMLQVGYDWGGTTLTTVSYDSYNYYGDYYNTTTSKIKAGQGLSFEAGASISSPAPSLELQLTVGYKFDRENTDNGDVTWDVVPFTALAMFKSNKWKIGGGVTYHLNPELDSDLPTYDKNGNFISNGLTDSYENAFGAVAKIQYRATPSLDIGLKGTLIEYELKKDPSYKAKGNSIGIVLSYSFGNERSEFR